MTIDVKALRALSEAATPGPWKGGVWETVWGLSVGEVTTAYVATETGDIADDLRECDAEFIIAARNNFGPLLDLVESQAAEIEQWELWHVRDEPELLRHRALVAELKGWVSVASHLFPSERGLSWMQAAEMLAAHGFTPDGGS